MCIHGCLAKLEQIDAQCWSHLQAAMAPVKLMPCHFFAYGAKSKRAVIVVDGVSAGPSCLGLLLSLSIESKGLQLADELIDLDDLLELLRQELITLLFLVFEFASLP